MHCEARPGAAPSPLAQASPFAIERIEFPQGYRRACLAARGFVLAALMFALSWVSWAWGVALPLSAWIAICLLAVGAAFPLVLARSPRAMELMWRARLKRDGEPGPGAWHVNLAMRQAVRNVPLLWWWPIGERVLVLGVAQRWWCPRVFVLAPPWFAAEPLRRMRRVLRLGPPPLRARVNGVS
ncbi:hypothetical protein [uncultured Ralstonia sp.]|jgi:hypothetical protein|uniref:hypothetical protein n=1 Tax=Ralstonia sp. TaxID=54061 RepID=UPI0025FE8523|nr:hypothetical protein [uncultured Ralstonia sp.]